MTSPNDIPETIKFEDWHRLAKKLASYFKHWVGNWGHTISYEDAYSEVCLRWVLARRGFKPELGFAFSTYFTRSVHNAVRPFVMSLRSENDGVNISLNDSILSAGDSDNFSLDNVLEDITARSPELIASQHESRDQLAIHAPMLHRLLTLMQECPDELMSELQAVKAQREYAHDLGLECYDSVAPTILTPKILARIFGLNWKQIKRLKNEFREAVNHVG